MVSEVLEDAGAYTIGLYEPAISTGDEKGPDSRCGTAQFLSTW